MKNRRHILSKKKGLCPLCQKKTNTLSLYLDQQRGDLLPDIYGRCDREIKCGYWLDPYKDGYAKKVWEEENLKSNNTIIKEYISPVKTQVVSHNIPYDVLKGTRKAYDQNNFINNILSNLKYTFNIEDIKRIISMYHLGTVTKGYMAGANTFPYIDEKGDIKAIQAKTFDRNNHTTKTTTLSYIIEKYYTKLNQPLPEWLIKYKTNDIMISCLFGAHLLSKYPHNPIALTESPKNAIIGTLYFGFPEDRDNFLWLGVYNVSSLNFNRCKILEGRNVTLFPDQGAYDKWNNNLNSFKDLIPKSNFNISNLLEVNHAKAGSDIADYLTKLNPNDFKVNKLHSLHSCTLDDNKHIVNELSVFEECNRVQRVQMVTAENSDPEIEAIPRKNGISDNQSVTGNNGNDETETNTRKLGISENQVVMSENLRTAENPAALQAQSIPVEYTEESLLIEEMASKPIVGKFDLAEYREWFKNTNLPLEFKFPTDPAGGMIYNVQSFIKGRLDHISAFTNYKESGNSYLFIRQLRYLRKHIQPLQAVPVPEPELFEINA